MTCCRVLAHTPPSTAPPPPPHHYRNPTSPHLPCLTHTLQYLDCPLLPCLFVPLRCSLVCVLRMVCMVSCVLVCRWFSLYRIFPLYVPCRTVSYTIPPRDKVVLACLCGNRNQPLLHYPLISPYLSVLPLPSVCRSPPVPMHYKSVTL